MSTLALLQAAAVLAQMCFAGEDLKAEKGTINTAEFLIFWTSSR